MKFHIFHQSSPRSTSSSGDSKSSAMGRNSSHGSVTTATTRTTSTSTMSPQLAGSEQGGRQQKHRRRSPRFPKSIRPPMDSSNGTDVLFSPRLGDLVKGKIWNRKNKGTSGANGLQLVAWNNEAAKLPTEEQQPRRSRRARTIGSSGASTSSGDNSLVSIVEDAPAKRRSQSAKDLHAAAAEAAGDYFMPMEDLIKLRPHLVPLSLQRTNSQSSGKTKGSDASTSNRSGDDSRHMKGDIVRLQPPRFSQPALQQSQSQRAGTLAFTSTAPSGSNALPPLKKPAKLPAPLKFPPPLWSDKSQSIGTPPVRTAAQVSSSSNAPPPMEEPAKLPLKACPPPLQSNRSQSVGTLGSSSQKSRGGNALPPMKEPAKLPPKSFPPPLVSNRSQSIGTPGSSCQASSGGNALPPMKESAKKLPPKSFPPSLRSFRSQSVGASGFDSKAPIGGGNVVALPPMKQPTKLPPPQSFPPPLQSFRSQSVGIPGAASTTPPNLGNALPPMKRPAKIPPKNFPPPLRSLRSQSVGAAGFASTCKQTSPSGDFPLPMKAAGTPPPKCFPPPLQRGSRRSQSVGVSAGAAAGTSKAPTSSEKMMSMPPGMPIEFPPPLQKQQRGSSGPPTSSGTSSRRSQSVGMKAGAADSKVTRGEKKPIPVMQQIQEYILSQPDEVKILIPAEAWLRMFAESSSSPKLLQAYKTMKKNTAAAPPVRKQPSPNPPPPPQAKATSKVEVVNYSDEEPDDSSEESSVISEITMFTNATRDEEDDESGSSSTQSSMMSMNDKNNKTKAEEEEDKQVNQKKEHEPSCPTTMAIELLAKASNNEEDHDDGDSSVVSDITEFTGVISMTSTTGEEDLYDCSGIKREPLCRGGSSIDESIHTTDQSEHTELSDEEMCPTLLLNDPLLTWDELLEDAESVSSSSDIVLEVAGDITGAASSIVSDISNRTNTDDVAVDGTSSKKEAMVVAGDGTPSTAAAAAVEPITEDSMSSFPTLVVLLTGSMPLEDEDCLTDDDESDCDSVLSDLTPVSAHGRDTHGFSSELTSSGGCWLTNSARSSSSRGGVGDRSQRSCFGANKSERSCFTQSERGKEQVHRRKTLLNVQFGNVGVRYYERILEINPSVSSGVAVGIGWMYRSAGEQSVDDWENWRQGEVRRQGRALVIPRDVRETTVKQLGYTQKDIATATRIIRRAKKHRRSTIHNLQARDQVAKQAGRAVRGILSIASGAAGIAKAGATSSRFH